MPSRDLENIYQMLVDSQKGYQEAAEIADAPNIAEFFANRAHERANLIEEFATIMPGMSRARDEGTVTGAAHRLFLNLRSLVQDDTKAALAEVERGESAFLEAIENALNDNDLDTAERQMVADLHDEVRADQSVFAEMRATL